MPTFSNEDEAFAAFKELNSEARQIGLSYRDTIAKSCITVITATIAVIGFLINAHQAKLLFMPHNSVWSLYIMFAGFGLAYALAVYSTKHYSNWLGEHSESIRYKAVEDAEESAKHEKLRDKAGKKLKFVARSSEICAVVGVIALLIFAIGLTRNAQIIFAGSQSTATTHKN